jgi:DNA gyrase/topoisomerase IV subunit B
LHRQSVPLSVDEMKRLSRSLTPSDVCAELLALSMVEYSYTPDVNVTITLDESGGSVYDTGRGMRIEPDKGDTLSHAQRALTGYYPCLPSNQQFSEVLHELIWGERGSLGPSLANFACPSFEFCSSRNGQQWSQRYEFGAPQAPMTNNCTTQITGTTVRFQTKAPIDHLVVAELVDALNRRIPTCANSSASGPAVIKLQQK